MLPACTTTCSIQEAAKMEKFRIQLFPGRSIIHQMSSVLPAEHISFWTRRAAHHESNKPSLCSLDALAGCFVDCAVLSTSQFFCLTTSQYFFKDSICKPMHLLSSGIQLILIQIYVFLVSFCLSFQNVLPKANGCLNFHLRWWWLEIKVQEKPACQK